MLRNLAMIIFLTLPVNGYSQSVEDQQLWEHARVANTVTAYQNYLESHPNGHFAKLAFRCSIELSLMSPGHECNINRLEPGPIGSTRMQIGTFPVNLR